MNRQDVGRATTTFVMLFVAGLGMVVGGYQWASVDVRQVLVTVGSAILGAALAFFLVEMFALERAGRK